MFICKNNLCELLESSLEFVNGNSSELKPLFYKAIDENEENFVVFESKLHIIRKIAEEDLQFFMDSDPAAHSLEEIK